MLIDGYYGYMICPDDWQLIQKNWTGWFFQWYEIRYRGKKKSSILSSCTPFLSWIWLSQWNTNEILVETGSIQLVSWPGGWRSFRDIRDIRDLRQQKKPTDFEWGDSWTSQWITRWFLVVFFNPVTWWNLHLLSLKTLLPTGMILQICWPSLGLHFQIFNRASASNLSPSKNWQDASVGSIGSSSAEPQL